MKTDTITARRLRRTPTEAEQHLWRVLRGRQLSGYKFRRQHPVGPFVADFACVAHLLIVEADGGQHADSEADMARTAWLQAQGWQVVRFWNDDILRNPEGVLLELLRVLALRPPIQRL